MGSNIGTEGAKYLSEALKINKTLTSLYLGRNNIDDIGTKYIFEALKTNKTLTSIHLGWNNFSNEGIKYITETLSANTTLTNLNIASIDNKIDSEEYNMIIERLKTNKTNKEKLKSLQLLCADKLKQSGLADEVKNMICEDVYGQCFN